ncbi:MULTISPECIES: hypothetical protein [Streptomyces]|uniref:Uncharacterized protein n=1 Tax=Streptomyces cacaoi TaxID=1898 RepID=A0A4Y3R764_STRCI|nr:MULTISPECIES: hypothetical protein [Streptomyces]NNG85875.1 hypothetical protein [Streptomyces cacaoi]QHF96224.1 hypothetical protein DEH18_22900 [Streptomyces sp. NHF165]GEB52587.1 hypothetical protein SCA03_51380 [Streptomyces cacaoi]
MSDQSDGFSVKGTSINGSSNLLIEIAGLLYEGRPDIDLCTATRVPRTPASVADAVARFVSFAKNQYEDTVALYAALSTKLRTAGTAYAEVDGQKSRDFLRHVLEGDYRSPESRPS